jgi:hypothetical protein
MASPTQRSILFPRSDETRHTPPTAGVWEGGRHAGRHGVAEKPGVQYVPDDGRTERLFCTATPPKGFACSGVVTTCVSHDQGQGSACVDVGLLYDALICPPSEHRLISSYCTAARAVRSLVALVPLEALANIWDAGHMSRGRRWRSSPTRAREHVAAHIIGYQTQGGTREGREV